MLISALEIHKSAKKLLGVNWLGVYPIDKIPFLHEGAVIINTQTSTLPGEHWIAISITPMTVKVFDPFGFYYPHLLVKKIHTLNRPVWYNRVQYQNITSKDCGPHCLNWLANQYKHV